MAHPLCNGSETLTPTETAALVAATAAEPAASASCAQDLGIGDKTHTGAGAPTVYDIGGFDNTGTDNGHESSSLRSSVSPVVAELHKLGDHAICYIDVGTTENWRADYSEFPKALLGEENGWSGESWLDTNPNDPITRPFKRS